MKILKYELNPGDQTIELPEDAEILHVGAQADKVCLWAIVDPEITDMESYAISVFATGEELPEEPGEYLGTVHLTNGTVNHVFAAY